MEGSFQNVKQRRKKKKVQFSNSEFFFFSFTTEDEGTINIKIWNSEGFFSKNQLIGELVLNVKEFSHGSEIVKYLRKISKINKH